VEVVVAVVLKPAGSGKSNLWVILRKWSRKAVRRKPKTQRRAFSALVVGGCNADMK